MSIFKPISDLSTTTKTYSQSFSEKGVIIYTIPDIIDSPVPATEAEINVLLKDGDLASLSIKDVKEYLIGNRNISELNESELRQLQFISLYFGDEFIQSSLHPTRDITQFLLGGKIISVPQKYYGHAIKPKSFAIEEFGYKDDGEGRIVKDEFPETRGYILYSHGFVFIQTIDPIEASHIKWESSVPVTTLRINAKAEDFEFNYSNNPTYKTPFLKEKVHKTPYISSIGLYNKYGELVALAKLSIPIKKSDSIVTSFDIKIDI